VEKGKDKPVLYSQVAKYEWMGGDSRSLRVRLVRDPAFKKTHDPEALRKLDPAPREV
jgi:hypothetical protein